MSFKEFRKMWHKAYWFYAGIYTAVGCVIAAIAWAWISIYAKLTKDDDKEDE